MHTMESKYTQIFRLALPSIISNITVPLLGLVDVAIVGHIGNATYISAIAVGSMLFNVIYWLFGFLRMGTGGMTSQAYGQRNLSKVVTVLKQVLFLGFVLGALFILLQYPIVELGMLAMKPDAFVIPLCRDYCYIVIWGAPAMLSLYGLTGWFVGMQNTRIPMLVSIVQNVVNILASLLFVFVLKLDIKGVALGTIVAQWSGFLLSMAFFFIYYRRLMKYNVQRLSFYGSSSFFKVNRDIFFRTLFLVSVFLFFTAAGSRQGTMILAVNTLLMEFFTLFSYFSDGFAYAGEALCGKYYGASNHKAFREVVCRLFIIGGCIAVFFVLLYMVGGKDFLGLLTNDRNVVEASTEYFWWAVLVPIVGIAAFLFDGVFVGITNTKGLLMSSMVAAICFFAVYFGLETKMANHALWLAFIVYLFMRGAVEFFIYQRFISCQ